MKSLETTFFKPLWNEYIQITPQAKKIKSLFEKQLESPKNDHVAVRTFNLEGINLNAFTELLSTLGFEPKGQYFFAKKNLKAIHLEHPNKDIPKIFISEYLLENAPENIGPLIQSLKIEESSFLKIEDLKAWRPWDISFSTYKEIAKHSEYAAWVYAFGIRANHFTVAVHELKRFHSMAEINHLIKDAGFFLNTSGGEVKGSREQYLEQSSTLAENIDWEFLEGTESIPSCYYEFAFRYKMPNGELYQGFVPDSADKIFESTSH
jgi:hypothetical protein